MRELFDRLNPFHSFDRRLDRALAAEAGRMATSPHAGDAHPDQPTTPTRATNGEVVTFTGALPPVHRIVAAAERKVTKAQAEFNADRDAADEARRQHRAAGQVRVPVPTGRQKVHRENATVVAGDSVPAGQAGAMADKLRREVGEETAKGWVGHLTALSPLLKVLGVVGLTFDVGSLLFLLFRTLNVGLSAAAFQRDLAGQLFGLVMSIGFATIAAIVMFVLTRQTGRLTWAVRNIERGSQVDPRFARRSRAAWIQAGLCWVVMVLLLPLIGFAVAQRLVSENEAAGQGAASSSIALLLGAVFAAGPIVFTLGESFAASAKMQRVAALGAIATRLSTTENALARRVLASENAADQVERQARTTVAIARREAALARLAADQLIWGSRGRNGHLGDLAAPIVLPVAAEGQLLPDVTFDAAFAPLEEMLQRMADRPAGDRLVAPSPAPVEPPAVHLATVQEPDEDKQAA